MTRNQTENKRSNAYLRFVSVHNTFVWAETTPLSNKIEKLTDK